MKNTLLVACILFMVGIAGSSQGRQASRPDGIYLLVEPVAGTGDRLFDASLMVEGAPMRQYTASAKVEETFDAGLTQIAVLAESHGGEVSLNLVVIKNGRTEFAQGAQGGQVVAHFNAWGRPYFAVFPKR